MRLMKGMWRKFQIKKLEFTLWLLTKGLKSPHPDFYLFFVPILFVFAVMLFFGIPFLLITASFERVDPGFFKSPRFIVLSTIVAIPAIYIIHLIQRWMENFKSTPKWMGGDPDLDIYKRITETQAKLKALTDA